MLPTQTQGALRHRPEASVYGCGRFVCSPVQPPRDDRKIGPDDELNLDLVRCVASLYSQASSDDIANCLPQASNDDRAGAALHQRALKLLLILEMLREVTT